MAESDAAGVTYAEMPRLDAVPHDIKLAIVWDDGLTWDDVAALRLTSRSLVEAASTRLFYTVAVSKLHRDRETFLTICRTPRLAMHVREVEWLELSWDPGFAKSVRISLLDSKYGLAQDEDNNDIATTNEALLRDIESTAKAAFWFPNDVPGGDTDLDSDAAEATRQAAVADFLPEFQAAIDGLPGLHTFVSRPMPPLRLLAAGRTNESYPVSAGTLQAFHAEGSPPPAPAPPQTNDGFFFFLAPTMARPDSSVTQLRWVDEQSGFSYTRAVPVAALTRLTSIDFRLVSTVTTTADAFQAFEEACAAAAPTVQHLGLSVVGHPGDRGMLSEDDLLLEDFGDGMSDDSWANDEDDAEDDHREPTPSKTDALGCMLLGRGLGTAPGCALRSLRLVGVRLVVELVDVIRANAGTLRHLHLESVGFTLGLAEHLTKVPGIALETIRVIEDYPKYRVEEGKMLRLLNSELPPDAPPTPRLTYDQIRKWPRKLFEIITTATFIDREIRDPYRNKNTCGCNRWHRPQHIIEEGDACLDPDPDMAVDAAPRWRWAWCTPLGQGGAGPQVYCYLIPSDESSGDGDGGHATEIWRFTDRDGTVGYGRDPLTWFDEWDPDAGDVEEPTPFSHALLSFVKRGPNAAKSGDHDGVCLPEPPEGAVAYDPDADPLINEDLAYDDGD